jgi:DNA ligase (NAD+)
MSSVREATLQKIIPPEFCPSCNSKLEWRNDQLFCTNKDCGSKLYKRVEHFAKTLRIKGLGPATIQKLDIKNISEIYELSKEKVAASIGSKLSEKLFSEIEKTKRASLNEVLPGFSIPLIGKTATEKLCKEITEIDEVSEETCKKAGLGPKATESLLNWYKNVFPFELQGLFSYKAKRVSEKETKGSVCISGKLKSFKTKSEEQKVLEEAGYKVQSSVTKETTILVNESGVESNKTKKARDNGIKIVTNISEII